MTDMTEKGSDFIRDLGDAARRNPVSAALIGMGLVWLFAGKSAVGGGDILHRTGLDRLPDAAKNTVNAAQDRLASAADAVRETGSDGIETATRMASEYAKSLPDSADVFGNVRENLTDLFKAQPLALGAIGLAIGAGIAAALPATEIENSYLGETSETLKSKAAEIAGDQIEKATSLATDVVETVAEEARKEGLTMDGAKAAMSDLSGKVGRVVDAAGKSVSESAR
ncbi:hypothetical protein ABIE49_002673 [Bradyrhizobium sp. OAE829]